jgi:hypothetical protein
MAFNHTGDQLICTGWEGHLELFDTGTARVLTAVSSMRSSFRFSRDDLRLAGAVRDGQIGIWHVSGGPEFRSLIHNATSERVEYLHASVHEDGRLLAIAMNIGFGIWDLSTGSELAFIPDGNRNNQVLFEPSGSLLTLSAKGLSRWPITKDLDSPGELVLGPAEPLPLPNGNDLDQSHDGKVIVTCDRTVNIQQPHAGGWILRADRPQEPLRLDAGADIGWIAVSPDGRWVVTGTHNQGAVKVWNASDGQLVKTLAEWGADYGSHFSPDGRWLTTGLDGGRLYAVETWLPGPKVDVEAVFTPDNKLMAVPCRTGIHLMDCATGRKVAFLESPHLELSRPALFSPNAAHLITINLQNGVHVWDLHLIRRQLKDVELDWDWPEFTTTDRDSKVETLRVKVRLGDAPDASLTAEILARQAIEHHRRAIAENPEDAVACNNLAWAYLTAPVTLRDVKAALPLAETAVRLTPTNGDYRNTLGVAYYRAGRFREAIEVLQPNLESQDDASLTFDLYFLAMSHQQLGESARARDYYNWAVRWTRTRIDPSAGHLAELTAFQAEADELLKQRADTTAEQGANKTESD